MILDTYNNEEKRNSALQLLRSVNSRIPDSVVNVLSPYVEKGGNWPQIILGCLCWNCKDDSDAMFELRLQLARLRIVKEFVYWKELAKAHPIRALRLIEAVISTWDTPRLEDNSLSNRGRQSRLEQWGPEEVQILKIVASTNAVDTWDLLMPHVERLTAIEHDRYDPTLRDWSDRNQYVLDDGRASISRGIVELLCESGKTLASEDADVFVKKAHEIHNSISPVTHEILITSYAAIPPEFSDEAIDYVLADKNRFDLGTGYNEPEWMPAVRLIKAQSPHCSEEIFQKLENTIIHYHPLDEIETMKNCVGSWKEGYFTNYWGRAQYFLLPAICQERRNKTTQGLIRVLERKFGKCPQEEFLRGGRMTGGRVGAPISGRDHTLSDRAWLEIVNNRCIPKDGGKLTQSGPDSVAESSVRQFSIALQSAAYRHPERFAQLALKFPDDVHPLYIARVLDAVKETVPKNIPDEEKSTWEPARIDTIEAILEKFSLGDESSVANAFCWLIRDRAEATWSRRAIDKLIHYATSHPDPESEKLNVYPSHQGNGTEKASLDDLVQNAINCVRGIAVLAIGALLREHPDWMERLKPSLERLVIDPHPAVRVAALEACLPLLNIDKDLSVDLFLKACKDDLRVAACHYAVYYFNCCIKSHFNELSPVIIQMLNSDKDEIAEQGAKEACARWLFYGLFNDEPQRCKVGSIAHRKAVAQIASGFMTREEYTAKCKDLLFPLFNDENADVRQETRHAFYDNVEMLKLSGIESFIQSFIQSQAFRDDPTGLLYTFEQYSGSLVPFSDSISAICDQFVGPLAELSRDISQGIAYDATKITSLLLRLYEQSRENMPGVANKCLDAWDVLFENRIGQARDLTKAIEQ